MCRDSGHSLRACRLAGLLAHVFGLHVHSTSHAKPGSDGRVFLCGGERCVYVSSWAGKHSSVHYQGISGTEQTKADSGNGTV
jgi:hypothetical protein